MQGPLSTGGAMGQKQAAAAPGGDRDEGMGTGGTGSDWETLGGAGMETGTMVGGLGIWGDWGGLE